MAENYQPMVIPALTDDLGALPELVKALCNRRLTGPTHEGPPEANTPTQPDTWIFGSPVSCS